MISLLLTVAVLLMSFWFHWRYKNWRLLQLAKSWPGPLTLPLIGSAYKLICKPEEFITLMKNIIDKYGDTVTLWLGPNLNIIVSNPDDVKTILTSTKASVKGPQYKYIAQVLGGGLLSGSGAQWKKHRKLATPVYSKRVIETYGDIFNQETDILLQKFRKVPRGKPINIYDYAIQATGSATCQTLLGLNREETSNLNLHRINELSPRMYEIVFSRITKWYLQLDPIFWLTKSYTELKNFNVKAMELFEDIIKKRQKILDTIGETKPDLMNNIEDSQTSSELRVIDRFLLSKDINRQDLLQEIYTIFEAAQEPTAKASSFLLLMMAYHPDCQEKLYNEIVSVMGDEDRPVTDVDLRQMPYLDMVFKEVLRLFPAGAWLQRALTDDIVISSGTLPAGSLTLLPIYHIHRDSRFWKNPDAFDPTRFTPENTKLRTPNCFTPFSLGPMDCLGRNFAAALVKTICIRALKEFKFTSLYTYKDLRLFISISVASINGFPVTVMPRKKL